MSRTLTQPPNANDLLSTSNGVVGSSEPSTRAAGTRPTRKMPKVAKRRLVNLSSQLAIMTRSGIDIATALKSLSRQSKNPAVQEMLQQVHQEVVGGRSFSAALSDYRGVFGGSYVASVAAGEASGKLPEVLGQLAEIQREELRLRSTLRTLLAYPVMLMLVSGGVIMGLVLLVLPQFATIFEQYEMTLPILTQILLAIATELRVRYWIWLPILSSPVVAMYFCRHHPTGRRLWDQLWLHAWIVRDVTRSLLMGRLCRLLGLMLESGVPLLTSLQLARSSVSNSLFKDLIRQLEEDVTNGQGMSRALTASQVIPEAACDTLLTAEKTGNLGAVARLLGEHFEQEAESRLREVVTILEPAITVGMGAVVATVVLAVMMPVFDLTTIAS